MQRCCLFDFAAALWYDGRMHMRIGTRGSELALAQTRLAIAALQAAHPGLECEVRIITTAGDRRTDIPLHRVNAETGTGDKGVFIAAIEEELAAGTIDCAVHSLKDMPGLLDERFALAAVLPREEIQDVLVLREGIPFPTDGAGLCIATGSVRRTHLLKSRFPKAQTVPVRGNVATRLRKVAENPELSGTLLARAGLNRLGYDRELLDVSGVRLRVHGLDPADFCPALGQGAVALETRRGDAFEAMVAAVNDEATSRAIRCERAFLHLLNADCSVPVGGYARLTETGELSFRAVYYPPAAAPVTLDLCGREPEEVAQQAYDALQARLNP